jgi:uncharacterized protein (TIGR02001 family)
VLGALTASSFVFAAEKETKSDFTTSGSVGLFSQYIFRGLTQTDRDPAMQGNFDINHSSGLYLGMWGSNVSWPRDRYLTDSETATFYKSGGSLELDIYGGFKSEIGKTGLGIDLGALQYYYPGQERGRDSFAKINTTEVYGALSYGWLQAKYSHVVSKDAWGWGKVGGAGDDGRGTYYAELNATVPIGELIGGGPLKGLTGVAHYGKQEFDGANKYASYEDYKLGLQNAFDNGVNIGAFWTDTKDASDSAWVYNGRNIGKQTGTVFLQKTF